MDIVEQLTSRATQKRKEQRLCKSRKLLEETAAEEINRLRASNTASNRLLLDRISSLRDQLDAANKTNEAMSVRFAKVLATQYREQTDIERLSAKVTEMTTLKDRYKHLCDLRDGWRVEDQATIYKLRSTVVIMGVVLLTALCYIAL